MNQKEYDKRYKTLYNAALGKQVKAWRIHRGLTQKELAHVALTSAKHISNIENGKVSIFSETQSKLIEALTIDPSQFHQTIIEEAKRKIEQVK